MKKIIIVLGILVLSLISFGKTDNCIKIHYKANQKQLFIQERGTNGWLPKKEMIKSYLYGGYDYTIVKGNKSQFKITDGVGKNEEYYINNSGEYIIENGIVSQMTSSLIQIHYKSNKNNVYIKYSLDGKKWIEKLILMHSSLIYEGYKEITIPANYMEFKIGYETASYKINSAGVYKLENKNLEFVTKVVSSKEKFIALYFQTEKYNVINYNSDNRGWEKKKIVDSKLKQGYKYTIFPYTTSINFYFENTNNIENNKSSNYYIDLPGVYKLDKNFNIEKIDISKNKYENFYSIKSKVKKSIQLEEINKFKNTILLEKISDNIFKVKILNKDLYYINLGKEIFNKAQLLDKDYNLLKEISIKKDEVNGNYRSRNILLMPGEYYIKTINIKNISKIFSEIFNLLTFTQKTYAEEFSVNDNVKLEKVDGWKEVIDYKVEPGEDKNYIHKKIGYNLELGFLTDAKKDISIKFINSTGPSYEKEFKAYKAKNEMYIVKILGVTYREITENNGNIKEINGKNPLEFEVYINGKLQKTYKLDIIGLLSKQKPIIKYPYNNEYNGSLNYLGIGQDNNYIFENRYKYDIDNDNIIDNLKEKNLLLDMGNEVGKYLVKSSEIKKENIVKRIEMSKNVALESSPTVELSKKATIYYLSDWENVYMKVDSDKVPPIKLEKSILYGKIYNKIEIKFEEPLILKFTNNKGDYDKNYEITESGKYIIENGNIKKEIITRGSAENVSNDDNFLNSVANTLTKYKNKADINLVTGDFNYKITDLNLPGKNNLNLKIETIYSTSFYDIEGKFKIGSGWRICFPEIILGYSKFGNNKNKKDILMLSNGSRIEIDNNKLKDHKLNNIKLKKEGNKYYLMNMITGITYVFDNTGKLNFIENRFKDKIIFIYKTNKIIIEDTYKNKIIITNKNNKVTIELPTNKNIEYIKRKGEILTRVDQKNRKTSFDYLKYSIKDEIKREQYQKLLGLLKGNETNVPDDKKEISFSYLNKITENSGKIIKLEYEQFEEKYGRRHDVIYSLCPPPFFYVEDHFELHARKIYYRLKNKIIYKSDDKFKKNEFEFKLIYNYDSQFKNGGYLLAGMKEENYNYDNYDKEKYWFTTTETNSKTNLKTTYLYNWKRLKTNEIKWIDKDKNGQGSDIEKIQCIWYEDYFKDVYPTKVTKSNFYLGKQNNSEIQYYRYYDNGNKKKSVHMDELDYYDRVDKFEYYSTSEGNHFWELPKSIKVGYSGSYDIEKADDSKDLVINKQMDFELTENKKNIGLKIIHNFDADNNPNNIYEKYNYYDDGRLKEISKWDFDRYVAGKESNYKERYEYNDNVNIVTPWNQTYNGYSITKNIYEKDYTGKENIIKSVSNYRKETGNLILLEQLSNNSGDNSKIYKQYDELDRLRYIYNSGDKIFDKEIKYDDTQREIIMEKKAEYANDGIYKVKLKYDIYDNIKEILEYKNNEWNKIKGYEYDEIGRLNSESDAEDNKIIYKYDELNRNTKIIYPKTNNGIIPEKRIKYLDSQYKFNRVKVNIDEEGNHNWNVYDNNDNLQFQCTFSGKKISFEELLTKVNNAEDIIKKLSSNEHISNKEKIDWIAGFRKIKTIINARDVKTIYYYDSLERLIKVEIPTEKIYIKYYYDLLGNIIKILTPKGSIVKQYNKRGELIKEIGKLNSEVLKGINKAEQGKIDEGDLYNIEIKGKTNIYKYDYLGNIIYKKDKKLQEFYYTYDSYNRLQYVYKNKIEEDNKIKEYKYYDDGSIKEVINSLEKESLNYKYYNDGSLKELVYPDGKSVKYEYNKNGNIKKVTDITNKYYKYIYDTRNRLWKIYDNNETDEKIEYQYYMNNKLEKLEEKKDKKTIYSEEYTYDIGNLMTLQGTLNEKKSLDYTYDYDKVGNLTTEINNISNQKNIYMYDGVNRLIRNLKINNGNDSIDRGYTYTTSGNISMEKYKVKVNNNWNETGGLWYNYNEDDELINITKWKGVKSNNNIWECKKEKNSFEYDDNGNLRNKSINGEKTEAYEYNIENRLTKYNDIKRGITGIYKYYPTNQRKSKAVNGLETKFYYSNNKIINDISNGEIKRNLFGLRGIIGREINGKNYSYLKNSHGDTLKLFDSSGTIKNNYEYDKYGKELKIEEDITNPFRYSGEYTDEESGLQYLRARYYSPEIRRFISRDTYNGDIKEPLSLNLYGYSKGNPISYVDPTGNSAEYGFLGTKAGEYASEYWANKYIDTDNSLYLMPLFLSSMWTRDTYDKTALTLLGGYAAQMFLLPTVAAESGELITKDSYAGVKQASKYLQNIGVGREQRINILQSFKEGTINMKTADTATYGLRFHDFGEKAYKSGSYLFPTFTNLTNRYGLALPPNWNLMTGLQQWQVQAGTQIITGKAASQLNYGLQYTGGEMQWWVQRQNLIMP
ncbi:RHS repeat domain-containing protein [Haliovirga abyssi]|uniref:RHS repeat protein n=1 Tax=Haliovirga abyssi TaxID=2996794 RepID=A0AAU9DEB2_9FUSO|nr:RHS repeat-associated core domain-containing protein [Haliovirga abyssi]BDU51685.1 hypothetical protein HLVA_22540 [Haliovirga abyssi]